VPATEAERLREQYRAYLVQERWQAAATITGYLHVARVFFAARVTGDQLYSDRLTAAEVTQFVLVECARSVGSAKYSQVHRVRAAVAAAILTGGVQAQLESAVPKVAGWHLAVCRSALAARGDPPGRRL
jgi:hypothetical protein